MTDAIDLATRLLRASSADIGDVDELPRDRDVAIARLADALAGRRRALRRRRILVGLGAVAASVLVVVGVGLAVHAVTPGATELAHVREAHGVTVVHHGREGTAADRVAEGTELRTALGGEARLDFDTGTQVRVGESARVRFVEQTKKKRFAVDQGSFSAKVAKLAADERFVVATPDAEIEVRGTEFRVRVVTPDARCGDGTPTRLEVSEGVVVVRRGPTETAVSAGEHWPSCASAPASAGSTSPSATASPAPFATTASAPSGVRARPSARAEASSSLVEQNDLFQDAMTEKRRGATGAAITKLDRLLATYPSGPLAESASVERMRLLSGAARERAARDYLARYPRGSARSEAEAALAGPR